MRTDIKRLLIGAGAFAAMLAAPAAAGAATTVVGSPLTGTVNNELACSPNCTVVNTAQAGTMPVKVPTDGTITSWSFKSFTGGVNAQYALRVVRPVSGGFVGAGTLPGPIVNNNIAAGTVTTQTGTSLPVKAGDFIGLDTLSGPGSPDLMGPVPAADVISYFAGPDLADSGSTQAGISLNMHQVFVQATVTSSDTPPPAATCTVPKVKGKKVGAAKKALKAAGCTPKVKKKFSSKKKGKVLSQSAKAGSSVPQGTVVKIKVSKGPKP